MGADPLRDHRHPADGADVALRWVSVKANGHVVTAILVAMVAMMFTAISYGRMARAYPSAGSAYTYVAREIHPVPGYVTGWSMVMDYMLNPLICTICCSKLTMNYVPGVPYAVWAVFFASLFTALNLGASRPPRRSTPILAAFMGVVIVAILIAAMRYVAEHPGLPEGFFTRPFYDPRSFETSALLSGTSLAVLTYIGFDGISTLVGGGREPPPQRAHRHGRDVPDRRDPRVAPGVRGAARLAGDDVSRHRHRVRPRQWAAPRSNTSRWPSSTA